MMTTTCVDSSDTQITNSTTTRKKPNNNNNQTKTQRKNNQSSHMDRVDSPNVKRNKKPKNISKNTDDSSSNANPFLSMKNNNRSVKKNHIYSGSGETVDKKENIFLNAANSRMKYDEKYVKHSNEKMGERGKNIFMASPAASPALSDDSSFRSYHNGGQGQGQGKRNETRTNSSSNYFIHNSKIQMSRQNPQFLEPIQSDIKTDKAVPIFVDIKDQQQFPSLSIKVEHENVSSNNTKQSVWNKRLKIDVISTVTVPVPVPVPVTVPVPVPVPVPVSVTEQPPAVSLYKPKILPPPPTPLYSLSKDNIFLAAFMKPTLPSLDDITETTKLDNTMISNAPLSALVDECDSTYDRFYN